MYERPDRTTTPEQTPAEPINLTASMRVSEVARQPPPTLQPAPKAAAPRATAALPALWLRRIDGLGGVGGGWVIHTSDNLVVAIAQTPEALAEVVMRWAREDASQ